MPVELNKENFQAVLDKITANPSCWKQDAWHCGTKHCFAGWAQVLSGKPIDDATVRADARQWLGLTLFEANYLFNPYRQMEDFGGFLAGYDRDGYDRDGYNLAGYNRAGYNRAGYDCAGYNRAGYNRDGYDCAGYNRAGYNLAGYDRDGYDCDGLNANNGSRS